MEPWQFGRVVKVRCAYDESRRKGEKYSVAVRDAVDNVKQSSPEMPISETGVKRILSRYGPKESATILCFERVPMSEADIKRHRWIREQFAALRKKEGVTLPELRVYDETRRRDKFLIRFSERTKYPRHNRKS